MKEFNCLLKFMAVNDNYSLFVFLSLLLCPSQWFGVLLDKQIMDIYGLRIQGAKEEVKKDRKHKKKEKKRKERENEAGQSKKHCHKRRREIANVSNKVDDHCKLINSEVELLEKSCLTVELELQTSSQNSCDSTLQSNERPKQSQSQPLDGRHNDSDTGIGNWLPGKRQKDFEAEGMITNKDQKWGQRLDASQAALRESIGHVPRDASRVYQEKRRDLVFDSREIETKLSKEKKPIRLKDNRNTGKEKMPSCTYLEQETPSSSHQETIGPSKRLCRKCSPSMTVQFLNLIENWTPDRFESKLTNSEDQECWLSMNFGAKRHQVCNQITGHGTSSTMWPTTRYLPEAEVHALPFTVPF